MHFNFFVKSPKLIATFLTSSTVRTSFLTGLDNNQQHMGANMLGCSVLKTFTLVLDLSTFLQRNFFCQMKIFEVKINCLIFYLFGVVFFTLFIIFQ